MATAAPQIGLYGLAVMGQNLALNIAEHGVPIAVCNRSPSKVCRAPLCEQMMEYVTQISQICVM
jgi:6-phosphogluconate dehydrogenase